LECTQTGVPGKGEYLQALARKVVAQRVPVTGGVALTHRCNLHCVHCYLPQVAPPRQTGREELSTGQWLRILDEVADAGCLTLLITGGEPLLRQDFALIYRHAKINGLIPTVFTNGTLISDQIAALFEELPPRMVEITLYGATAATYERITGVAGSFARCQAGIQRLLRRGVRVGLKTVLMTWNQHELSAMQEMAKHYGVRFRFDAAISARLDGDKAPIRLRVAAEEAAARELADPAVVRAWRRYFDQRGNVPVSQALYACGAGQTAFHVDAYGWLQPCLMTSSYAYDLLSGGFEDGWQRALPLVRKRKLSAGSACLGCEKRVLCGFCPAFCSLESGVEDNRSEYLCALGHLRYEAIVNDRATGRDE
jgi:radical SAM protein with 4Fe4S-binding SPASM domain